jgi:tellurite resistance protein TehA-like permease
MTITIYLLRLITYGPPDISLILSAFIVLGPLGQGGYSLLVNGEVISTTLPATTGSNFPQTPLTGQIIYGVCFCGAYILWSIGICWIIISAFSTGNQVRKGRIPFSIAYW